MLRLTIALAAWLALSNPAIAQTTVRPELDWRTISTRYFDIHFPAHAEGWTRQVAARMDAVRDSVAQVVGHAPDVRVTVMVEDPVNSSNGFAIPFLRGPVIMLWPTPVAPPHVLANNRSWGDVLAVHEYAHVAHLSRPSRNATQRLLWKLLPVELGPVMRRSPRWVFEGYATWVEGWLTGSGRPNGAWRAAILRQLAIEGALPSYAQLNGTQRFHGGAMAYLAGSAFLEWLDEQSRLQHSALQPASDASSTVSDAATEAMRNAVPGESFVRLWRRMSARSDRGFEEAFTGTFGVSPAVAYGRFTAELTASSMAVRDSLASAHNGELVQHLTYGTASPALSPDGTRLAFIRRWRDRPAELQVIRTDAGADSAAERALAEARRKLLERDPDDVPATHVYPLPRKPVATLAASEGRPAANPRFLGDGQSILFARLEPHGNEALRWDLSIWEWESGRERRITRGAGIREADPAPDGRTAVGVACEWGICNLVRVDLGNGSVEELLAGEPDVQYAGARVAPDGTIAVAEQRDGHWRILLLDERGSRRYVPTPDSASRYSPAFGPDGASLVVTSERGGIPHLEQVNLATGSVAALARPSGASFAPEVAGDGTVFFLSLHASGHDLRRTKLNAIMAREEFGPMFGQAFGAATSRFTPAVPPVLGTSTEFDTATVESRSYSRLPGLPVFFPGGGYDASGGFFSIALSASDPVGRLGVLLEGGTGDRSSWRGGGLSAAWRRWPVHLAGNVSIVRSEPSFASHAPIGAGLLDAELRSATLALEFSRQRGQDALQLTAGASVGRLELLRADTDVGRSLAFMEARMTNVWLRDRRFLTQHISLSGTAGTTDGESWSRALARVEVNAGAGDLHAGVGLIAGTAGQHTPVWEQFTAGGSSAPFSSRHAWNQRIPLSALPAGSLVGTRLLLWRVHAGAGLPANLRPFITSVSTDRNFDNWQRFAGLEVTQTFDRIPYLRLPNVALYAGWARKLTNPDKGRDTFTGGVRFTP